MDQYQSRCTSLDLGLGRKEEVAVVDKLLLGGKKLREVDGRKSTYRGHGEWYSTGEYEARFGQGGKGVSVQLVQYVDVVKKGRRRSWEEME